MGSWGAVVSTGGARNCFIKIPASWAPKLDRNKLQVFQLRAPTGETLYTTWQGDVSDRRDSDIIEISGLYATKQGINDGTQVVVTKVDSVIFCECLFVEPLSVDDWEILELHAQWVEQHLLDQVRVVWSGQVLPLWVGGNICIFVKVESVEPAASCCLLEPTTELHIAPKDRRRAPPPASQPAREKSTRPRPSPDHGQDTPHDTVTTATRPAHKSNQADARPQSTRETPTNIEQTAPSPEVENPDFLHWLIGYFQTLLFGVRAPAVEAGRGSPQGVLSMYTYKKELLPGCSVCTLPLRVQPCGELYTGTPGCPSLGLASEQSLSDVSPVDIAHQPSCVYVNLQSYCDLLSHRHRPTHPQLVPRTFLAALKPSKTPAEREEAITKTMLNKKPAGTETNGSGSDALPEDPSPEACSAVRVVLVDRDNAFTLRAPGGQTIAQVRFSPSKGPLPGHVMISDLLRRQMSLQSMSIACLQPLVDSEGTGAGPADVTGITLHPLFTVPQSFSEEMIVMAFKAWIREVTCLDYPLVVSNGTLIKLFLKQDLDGEFLVTLDQSVAANAPSIPAYCLLQLGACEDLTVKVAPRMTAVNRPPTVRRLPCWNLAESDPQLPAVSLQQLGGVKELYAEMSSNLATSLAHRPLDAQLMAAHCGQRAGILLLTGPKGSGKSALARAVCRALGELPTAAHVTVIDCKPLRGKRADTIQKQFHKAFTEAAWRQPAVLLLDDLDHVTAAPAGPEQEMSGEAVYYARIAEVLKDLLHREVVERSAVVVVATCRSQKSLHPTLTSSRGHHLCQKAVHISPPDKAQREAMLEALLTFRGGLSVEAVQGLDLTRVSGQTEGYVVRDLEQVVDRALHARRMARNNKDSGRTRPLSDSDFTAALKGFTPMGLRHVTLQDSGDVTWSCVGGLHAVRRALIETLQWPSKYPQLFASCPLRLRAGLLLYGAPGTGKTLLAAAVAKECGLNFISIKGPELLSKYIGASEQAVRETFERAQSAKPCILFFDEFDSLAPRRGHDNTGVTDRVVNQLLTQLDGVEGLEGVYVLAATSRPDLIDPALLRPGRLDKALHCALPSKEERVEILEALSRHMSLADDVDLHQVAAQCSYFTGADLKALLYNAQLAAIHQTTDLWAGLRNASIDMTDRATASLDSPSLDAAQQKPGVSTRGTGGLESRTSFEYLLPENGSHDEGTRERNHSSVSEGSSGSDLSVGQSHSWEVVPIDPEKSKEKIAEKVGAEKAAKEIAAVELKVEPTESCLVEPAGRSVVEPVERSVVEPPASGRLVEPAGSRLVDPASSRLVAYLPRLEDGVLTLTPREQQDILNKYPETTEKSETTLGRTPVISSLSQRHLMEAARTMQPSVSESERRKFEQIYGQFVASKGGGGFSGSMSEVGQRATLA